MDEIDAANDISEHFRELAERNARSLVLDMPDDGPGECDECGYEFTRLVDGLCGRCRDELDKY